MHINNRSILNTYFVLLYFLFYFVWVRFRIGQPSDSWWKRIGYINTPVLATEDEFRNLRRGDRVKIYYKPGYWLFFVSESK